MGKQEIREVRTVAGVHQAYSHILTVESEFLLSIPCVLEPHPDEALVALRSHDGLARKVRVARRAERGEQRSRLNARLNRRSRFRGADRFEMFSYHLIN